MAGQTVRLGGGRRRHCSPARRDERGGGRGHHFLCATLGRGRQLPEGRSGGGRRGRGEPAAAAATGQLLERGECRRPWRCVSQCHPREQRHPVPGQLWWRRRPTDHGGICHQRSEPGAAGGGRERGPAVPAAGVRDGGRHPGDPAFRETGLWGNCGVGPFLQCRCVCNPFPIRRGQGSLFPRPPQGEKCFLFSFLGRKKQFLGSNRASYLFTSCPILEAASRAA